MLDEKSLAILKILQEKARIPNVEVSRQVNLAPSAVLERIRKLEKNKTIEGYEVRLNPDQFGCGQIAFTIIKVRPDYATPESIGAKLSAIAEVQEVHYIAGEDGYLIKVRASDTKALATLLRQKIFPIEGVATSQTMTVLETLKETSRIPINP